MRKLVERVVAVCLALAIVITAFTPVETQAATKTVTKKLTAYVGENLVLNVKENNVTSIKFSKPSVVRNYGGYDCRVSLVCEKVGKATVTVKTKTKTYKYVITVKKNAVTTSITPLSQGRVLLAVTNNSSENFNKVRSFVFLKGSGSTIIRSDTYDVDNVPANSTVYKVITYSSTSKLNLEKSKCRLLYSFKFMYENYKDVSSKMKTSVKAHNVSKGCEFDPYFNVKVTNPLKKKVTGTAYVVMYDADGNAVAADTVDFTIAAGKSKSVSLDCENTETEEDVSECTYEVFVTARVKN
jgi:hypothetical protein